MDRSYPDGRPGAEIEVAMKNPLYLVLVFSLSLAGSASNIISAQRSPATTDVTLKAVNAAKAFLATLDIRQQAAVVVPLNKDTRSKWSNLPNGAVGIGFQRNGVKLGDLTPAQQKAALDLVGAALSPIGYRKVMNIVNADEEFARSRPRDSNPARFGRNEY